MFLPVIINLQNTIFNSTKLYINNIPSRVILTKKKISIEKFVASHATIYTITIYFNKYTYIYIDLILNIQKHRLLNCEDTMVENLVSVREFLRNT